jgi:hypothetical protein
MRGNVFVVTAAAAALFMAPSMSKAVQAQGAPAGQAGAPAGQAPAAQAPGGRQGGGRRGGGDGAAQGPAGGGRAIQGGGGQGVVGGVTPPDGRQGGGGRGGRGGRGPAVPAGPAPRNAQGRALLTSATPAEKGVWTPNFSITAPLAPANTIPFMDWSRALWEDREKNELEPHTRCKASGVAREFLTPYGVEFVEIPELKQIFIFDIGGPHTYRIVYMDGREHPKNFRPTYYGHSVGHWEGDTLVVDSVGFNESFWMDRRGVPHTDQLHTIEKFTRTDSNTINYEATIDDPGAYTGQWTGKFTLRWEANTELFEYVCQQDNQATELMVGEFKSVDRSSDFIP